MVIQAENKSKKNFLEKIGRRNIIVACAVLLIGAVVWVNWLLFDVEEEGYSGYGDGSGTVNAQGNENEAEDSYFATVQISRERTHYSLKLCLLRIKSVDFILQLLFSGHAACFLCKCFVVCN